MRLRVNHYFSKDPDLPMTFGIEAILTELFAGAIAGSFAFMGYYYGILGILVLCSGACIICVIATLYSIYGLVRDKYLNKKHKLKEAGIDGSEI